MKPVYVGVTTSLNENEQRLDHAYVTAVELAGGIPVIVPMLESDSATRTFAGLLDALIITGGPAIVEGLVGELPTDIGLTDNRRMRSDKLVLRYFVERRKPVFGICYGMQLINAAFGGQIYADVESQVQGAQTHSKQRGGTTHPVNIESGSQLSRILNAPSIDANTRHVQAIASVGSDLVVNAYAPDGVIEGLESLDGLLLGVQFHPEKMGEIGLPLFADLVNRARLATQRPV